MKLMKTLCSFSNWQSVTSEVPQGSVLGPKVFSIFINIQFDEVTTLSVEVDTLKGRATLQKDRLGEWASKNLMRFYKDTWDTWVSTIQAEIYPAEEQLCGKVPECPSGQLAQYE